MSGENPYSINDLNQLDEYLKRYTEEEGLYHAEINEEVKTILDFKAEDLKALSASDLYIASCLVTSYTTYILSLIHI